MLDQDIIGHWKLEKLMTFNPFDYNYIASSNGWRTMLLLLILLAVSTAVMLQLLPN